jgi:tRNA(Arg) A34 adenosine deaminase TadA
MTQALAQAHLAAERDEVPVGAVVVHQGKVIGQAHNRRELDQDPTAHAEILALRQAAAVLGSWRLCGTTLYVTLEPCPMCAGALVHARVEHLVYGCGDPKAGAVRTLYQLCEDPRLNHRLQVTPGVLAEECGRVLRDFFAALRAGRTLEP